MLPYLLIYPIQRIVQVRLSPLYSMDNETQSEKTARELLETAKIVAQQLILHADGKDLDIMREEITKAIGTTVNGKIDKVHELLERQNEVIELHHQEHKKDMERILPVIEAFEEKQKELLVTQKLGKKVLWISGFVTAVGAAVYMIVQALKFAIK